jgi:hypothetical protein
MISYGGCKKNPQTYVNNQTKLLLIIVVSKQTR